MENNVIVVARRESAQRSINGSLSSLGLFTVFLIFDIVFYVKDRYTWELVLLIISAVLVGFSLLGLLFAWGNFSYAKKIIDKPLITFDEDKKVFKVIDCIFHKEVEIAKDDFIEVMCPYCKRTLKRDWSIPDVCPYCKERVSNSLN